MKTNSPAKEQALNPTPLPRNRPAPVVEQQDDELDARVMTALEAASEKKALHTVVLDLREIASFTDYFVITSGKNERQVQAIADGISETLKRSGSQAARVEGYKTAEWILLDFGDFVVHVFEEKARSFYDLERLWRESKRVSLPPEIAGETDNSLKSESRD
jgi:ribosome-associated protein